MKKILEVISAKQREIQSHPFFEHLKQAKAFSTPLPFAVALSFWPMVFQDMLRLNEARVQGNGMLKIAHHHRREDAGHDHWFLSDLDALGVPWPDLGTLFSKEHEAMRDACYALMSEVYRAENDHSRVVLLWVLESAGHVFFERVADYVDAIGASESLKYFSRFHLNVEKKHELLAEETEEQLEVIVLSEQDRSEISAMIDRCYEAFEAMFDVLSDRIRINMDRRPARWKSRLEELSSPTGAV